MTYLNLVKQKFNQLLPNEDSMAIPCGLKEIENYECQLNLIFPSAYKEFLLWMGHSAGDFWTGYDCFFDSLTKVNNWARELADKNEMTLGKTDFVFFWDSAQSFYYFDSLIPDDPPVWLFVDSDLLDFLRQNIDLQKLAPNDAYLATYPDTKLVFPYSPSFSSFLSSEIDLHKKITDRKKQR